MSGSGESPADEDPGVVNPSENNVVTEDPAKDVSDAETEPAMLEDEEMPTYMSLTSSSRPDETGVEIEVPRHPENDAHGDGEERASSPYASEQGAESVCVLSSGEESDRDRRPFELMDDYDSDDIDMAEEEDEDDEEDDSYMNDEESDGDIEPEQFERSSDDFVLRYDGGLEKHHKERSRSLQDLTNSRGNLSRFVGKRRSIDLMGGYETGFPQQNFGPHEDPLSTRKKVPRSVRYDHVSSKVKIYIQEMKEQSRRSAERKIRENHEQKNIIDSKSHGDNPDVVSCTRLNPANRMIKNYAQNAMNEIAIAEQSEIIDDDDDIYNDLEPIDNRPEMIVMSTTDETKEIAEREKYSREDVIAENLTIPSDPLSLMKNPKSNGLIDYSTRNNVEKIIEPMETSVTNGQEQIAAILNLRSLSYEEYTNGEQTPNTKINIVKLSHPTIEEKNGIIDYDEDIIAEPEPKISAPKLEITKVSQQIPVEIQDVHETWELRKSMNDKFEEMSTTLKQKNAQIDHMRDAYQKTLTENMSLRRELNELRKTLEECRAENQPRETKVASVQTEILADSDKKIVPTDETKPPNVKLSSSSVTSALSSMEQWSDSNCSPAISIDPPNIALTSDDSLADCGQTPRKSARLSRSFVTSSRILQTLANITQGRTKSSSTISQADVTPKRNSHLESEKGQSKNETNTPMIYENEENSSRARKRKASDMLGDSSQPFKMPHTPGDTRKKMNSHSDTDGVVKMDQHHHHQGRTSERNDDNANETEELTGDDFHDTEATEVPDNVKCFVYHEEPDSKERSFLIQAEDDSKNETSEKTGTVRECGPYLLGNVEIRMSEANGTINIWGKEINQSTDDTQVDADMEESEFFERPSYTSRSSHDCHTTPRPRFPNCDKFVCSTNKKSRLSPQFARSTIGKYLRPGLSNLTRTSNVATNESPCGRYASSRDFDNRTASCERCEIHQKRVKWPSCEHLANSRVKKHSCCHHDVQIDDRNCDCAHETEDNTIYESMSNILGDNQKCTNAFHNATTKHSCANEGNCRHHSAGHEEDLRQTKKRCSSCAGDLPSCSTRLTPGSLTCRDNRSCSYSHVSCEDEEQPLLSNDIHCETSETKRRRLSGKKVRGILTDLLRGCGGCREPQSTSSLPRGSASLQNMIPKVRPSSCTSPHEASCSKRPASCPSHSNLPSNDHINEKGCTSCFRRVEMRSEIETQLEILRVDMERLHSRSNAFLQMLNLLNGDTD